MIRQTLIAVIRLFQKGITLKLIILLVLTRMKLSSNLRVVESVGSVNFEDKSNWEHLFKDYWTETKAKHNFSLAELEQAKSLWKGSGKQESLIAQPHIKDDNDSDSVVYTLFCGPSQGGQFFTLLN
ncbi:hypothetical protein L1987_22443 [Smallanthus sonchifolius]|uniref:Uncharacterized protein n=1 Tax=Smallanthus sonchifolius TaxID=185202 RepID=A0ACB9IGB9_9ASTR|nr:hypothetical protein L1987_22443 [Smallanthus sonchifolius]